MKKAILWYIEKILSALMWLLATFGTFLIGSFVAKLWLNLALTNQEMVAIGLASIILTFMLSRLLANVQYMRFDIIEEEINNDEEFSVSYERFKKKLNDSNKETETEGE